MLWERHAARLHTPRVGAKRVGEFVETIDAEVSLNSRRGLCISEAPGAAPQEDTRHPQALRRQHIVIEAIPHIDDM